MAVAFTKDWELRIWESARLIWKDNDTNLHATLSHIVHVTMGDYHINSACAIVKVLLI